MEQPSTSNDNCTDAPSSAHGGASSKKIAGPARRALLAFRYIALLALLSLAPMSRNFACDWHMAASPAAPQSQSQVRDRRRLPNGGWAPTLCIYVFSDTDPEYVKNLHFFVKFGMTADDGLNYIVVVQEHEGKPRPSLPQLPAHARYVYHPNECYDWGTIGWVFKSGHANPHDYKFFLFMNSSVRGPFVAPYARGSTRWQDLFFNRLTEHVKAVGPTISCEGSPYQGNVTSEWRTNPHVQSYALATDEEGMNVWLRDGNVFACWTTMWDVIWHGELGSSKALLDAGYGLDSFMLRYQGVNWTDEANWGCNKRSNPHGEFFLDGTSISPFEVLFVKMKERFLQNDWSFAVAASKYGEWMEAQAARKNDVTPNSYHDNPRPLRYWRQAGMEKRGSKCFDHQYYLQQNSDLKVFDTKEKLWQHFIEEGAYKGRAFRFTC